HRHHRLFCASPDIIRSRQSVFADDGSGGHRCHVMGAEGAVGPDRRTLQLASVAAATAPCAGKGNGRETVSPIIDIYCHIFPDRYFQEMTRVAPNLENIGKRLRRVTKLFDLDARFKEMDEFGDYRQIISLPNPAIEDIARPDAGLNLARIAND